MGASTCPKDSDHTSFTSGISLQDNESILSAVVKLMYLDSTAGITSELSWITGKLCASLDYSIKIMFKYFCGLISLLHSNLISSQPLDIINLPCSRLHLVLKAIPAVQVGALGNHFQEILSYYPYSINLLTFS